jgi:hypothetical protein
MVEKAKENRAKLIEDAIYQREFIADQVKLKKKMKNALLLAINQEAEKVEFAENWLMILYFVDILQDLRDHVAQRRQRYEDIKRVCSDKADIRHHDSICFQKQDADGLERTDFPAANSGPMWVVSASNDQLYQHHDKAT